MKVVVRKNSLKGEEDQARRFRNCISSGRVHEALRMLAADDSEEACSGVLKLDEVITDKDGWKASVNELLVEKHPGGQSDSPEILIEGDTENVNGVRFAALAQPLCKR